MNQVNEIEQVKTLVTQRIKGESSDYKYLSGLINATRLHTELLKIASYEFVIFHINPANVILPEKFTVDRLTLVYPSSYSFSIDVSVAGFYKVKYKTSKHTLPQTIEPFRINYSGIIVLEENKQLFKNENVMLLESV